MLKSVGQAAFFKFISFVLFSPIRQSKSTTYSPLLTGHRPCVVYPLTPPSPFVQAFDTSGLVAVIFFSLAHAALSQKDPVSVKNAHHALLSLRFQTPPYPVTPCRSHNCSSSSMSRKLLKTFFRVFQFSQMYRRKNFFLFYRPDLKSAHALEPMLRPTRTFGWWGYFLFFFRRLKVCAAIKFAIFFFRKM